MNQILFSEMNNNSGRQAGARPVNTKASITSVVKFFCICLIIFGVCLAGTGVYAVVSGTANGNKIDTTIQPVLQVQKIGEDTLTLVINHNQPIKYIEYNWNGEENQRVNGDGRKNLQVTIDIIPGNNELNIVAEDVSGNQGTYNNEFSYVTDSDMEKPKLDLQVSGNYVKITATDDTEMAFIAYYWNDEEPTILKAVGVDLTTITTSIEVRKGENKLIVEAVDEDGNSETIEKTYKGVTRPTIDVAQSGDTLIIKVDDVEGIQYVDIDLNEQRLRLKPPEVLKTLTYELPMEQGHNMLTVVAYSINGESTKYEGQGNNPPQ